jgi:putative membrane protein
MIIDVKILTASVVYALLGIALLFFSYFVLEKITPEATWKEVVHNKNTAVAIVLAAYIIALGLIISSAIHG